MDIDLRDGKSLVVYFSRPGENYGVGETEHGSTEIVAAAIEAELGKRDIAVDSFRIIPVEAYPKSYEETLARATEERNSDARPDYEGDVDYFVDYDVIYLGYPIWWGDLPMIVYNFIEKHEFAGKVVIPFCTDEGSGESGTFAKLKKKLENADVLQDGFEIAGSKSRDESIIKKVSDWLDKLGV